MGTIYTLGWVEELFRRFQTVGLLVNNCFWFGVCTFLHSLSILKNNFAGFRFYRIQNYSSISSCVSVFSLGCYILRNVISGSYSMGQSRLVLCAHLLSHVQLFETPWTIACHGPMSMEFSRQEYWRRLPFPTLGDFPVDKNFQVSPTGHVYFFLTFVEISALDLSLWRTETCSANSQLFFNHTLL